MNENMQAYIEEQTLTDGSKVFDVIISEGETDIILTPPSEAAARKLLALLLECEDIEPARADLNGAYAAGYAYACGYHN